jgi:modulator of FtsH protease
LDYEIFSIIICLSYGRTPVRYIMENTMQDKGLYRADSIGIESVLSTNKVLRNTYMLLGMTLLFSSVTAGISMALGLAHGTAMILSLVGFGLLFVVHKTADSGKGLVAVFAFTGVMGASIGPMLNHYLAMPGGSALVMQALGGTAVVFFGLSAYALTTRKDFSYMGGFLTVGLLMAVVAMIANIFLNIPVLSLTISAAVVMIMSGLILFDTSRIINGGETNYIRATVSLYLSIYNLFIHLLSLLTAFSGDD